MIPFSIRIHDKFQYECSISYPIRIKPGPKSYTVEYFVFFPSSLHVTPFNYPHYLFYRNLQNYLRFKTPEYSLKDFVYSANTPLTELSKLYESLSRLQKEDRRAHRAMDENFENQIKLFCCAFKSSLRNSFQTLQANAPDPRKVQFDLGFIQNVLAEFRLLNQSFSRMINRRELQPLVTWCDEYLSLVVE